MLERRNLSTLLERKLLQTSNQTSTRSQGPDFLPLTMCSCALHHSRRVTSILNSVQPDRTSTCSKTQNSNPRTPVICQTISFSNEQFTEHANESRVSNGKLVFAPMNNLLSEGKY